jgi:hypothetical protein
MDHLQTIQRITDPVLPGSTFGCVVKEIGEDSTTTLSTNVQHQSPSTLLEECGYCPAVAVGMTSPPCTFATRSAVRTQHSALMGCKDQVLAGSTWGVVTNNVPAMSSEIKGGPGRVSSLLDEIGFAPTELPSVGRKGKAPATTRAMGGGSILEEVGHYPPVCAGRTMEADFVLDPHRAALIRCMDVVLAGSTFGTVVTEHTGAAAAATTSSAATTLLEEVGSFLPPAPNTPSSSLLDEVGFNPTELPSVGGVCNRTAAVQLPPTLLEEVGHYLPRPTASLQRATSTCRPGDAVFSQHQMALMRITDAVLPGSTFGCVADHPSPTQTGPAVGDSLLEEIGFSKFSKFSKTQTESKLTFTTSSLLDEVGFNPAELPSVNRLKQLTGAWVGLV